MLLKDERIILIAHREIFVINLLAIDIGHTAHNSQPPYTGVLIMLKEPSLQLVYTTISSKEAAEALGEQVISLGYAACVNLIPNIHSIYRWKNEIKKGDEYGLLFKTTIEKEPLLSDFIYKNHPYEVSAILKAKAHTTEAFFSYIQENTHE